MTYLIHNGDDKVISAFTGEYKDAVKKAKALNAAFITEVGGQYADEVCWQKRS